MKKKKRPPTKTSRPGGSRRPRSDSDWDWKRDGLRSLVVVAATLLVFANSIGNGWVYDDLAVIRDDTRRETPWELTTFFSTPYWMTGTGGLYRPLTIWSFAVDREFFGEGPLPVHVSNVIAGSLLAGCVYAFLFLLLRKRALALAGALLFALHPVHTEVMANGVGRSEIYSGLFSMIAAILHVQASGRRSRMPVPPGLGYGLAVCFYFVAMLFKESAATLPGLLFLADWLVREEGNLRAMTRRFRPYVAYAAVLALYLGIRSWAVGTSTPPVQEVMHGLDAPDRMLYASKTLLAYFWQLLVPLQLLSEYSDFRTPIGASLRNPLVSASILIWIALGFLITVLVRRKQLIPVFGLAWFFLSIVPVSNLLFPIGSVRADRFLFIPSLGFSVTLAWLILTLSSRRREVGWVVFAVLLLFYGWRTTTRNLDWKSQESLWLADLPKNPGAAVGWSNLGDVYRDQEQWQDAEDAYRKAFELRDTIGFFPEAHNNYAGLMRRKGNNPEAKHHLRLVVSKSPGQFTALTNLGEMLIWEDSTRVEAIDLLERAIRTKPTDPAPRVNLAQAYRYQGQFDLAADAIDGALALNSSIPEFWDVKANILGLARRIPEARAAAQEAERLRGGAN